MRNIEDLHFTWEENVDNFFEWLEFICGVKKTSQTYMSLQNRIINKEDLDAWIDVWVDLSDGDIDNIQAVSEEYLKLSFANKDTYTY